MAIKLATQAFRVYLLEKPFTVQTDHRALEWLDKVRENDAKFSCWSLALQPFQFVVQHRPGKENQNADSCSGLRQNEFCREEGERDMMDWGLYDSCLCALCIVIVRGADWTIVCMAAASS